MIRDIRYAARTLVSNPAFTMVAVLTLALGIAANTAIFSAVDAVLLHPLPFSHPEELVDITKTMAKFGLFQSVASPLDFRDYQSHSKVFSQMSAIERSQFNLTGRPQPERIPGMRVTGNLFPLLGVNPLLGRAFTPEEEQWGKHKVVILSETLWRRSFGEDPRILGKQIQLDGENYTVIGVSKPMLAFVSRSELWAPLAFSPDALSPRQRGHQHLDVVARMSPGVTLAKAQADLDRVAVQMTKELPDWYPAGWSINAAPLSASVSGPIRTPLLVLVGAVALVLLIGCVNVSNLLLARASARQKEITIRTALGAGRWRIIRQLLFESAAVSIVAGAIGLLASVWMLDLFERLGPQGLLRGQHLALNSAVAAFTFLVSLVSTFVFGLAPAVAASRVDLQDTLKETSRSASGSAAQHRMRSVLVASEVALSLTLLISAGLLIRSFTRLQDSSPGFDPGHLLVFQVSLPVTDYRESSAVGSFQAQLLDRLAAIPGAATVGAISSLPFSGSNSGGSFDIIGRPWDQSRPIPDVSKRQVSPDYFAAMRIPVLKGRAFTAADGPAAPRVAVVDEPFARQIFPNENAIGKQLSGPPDDRTAYTIVGIVGGVKHKSLSAPPEATIYYASLQAPNRVISVVIRTAGDPLALVSAVRNAVRSLNRDLPVYRVMPMEQLLSDSLARTRFATVLLSVLASLALLLAAIGIYGVIGYSVTQRKHEIGIRMALGADPRDAIRLVLRQGAAPILAGIAAGLLSSLAATRWLQSLLYGVSATDPLIFAALSVLLAAVAFIASYIPARTATKVDPMVALRYE